MCVCVCVLIVGRARPTMVWHGDGLLRATARPVMAVLGGLTLSITVGNKGNI